MTLEAYNFAAPASLGMRVQKELESWMVAFSAQAKRDWASRLPFSVLLELENLRTVRSELALAELPEDVIAAGLVFHQSFSSILVFPRRVLLFLVAGLLGEVPTEMPEDRGLTAVEDSLADHALEHLFVSPLKETWRAVPECHLEMSGRASPPGWGKLFSPEEALVVCEFLMVTKFGQEKWHWLLSRKGLEEVFLPNNQSSSGNLTPEEQSSLLQSLIENVLVQLSVTLGSVELPVSQLARLRVGDLLVLDQGIHEKLNSNVAGKVLFQGWPGRLGRQQAFKIETVVSPDGKLH